MSADVIAFPSGDTVRRGNRTEQLWQQFDRARAEAAKLHRMMVEVMGERVNRPVYEIVGDLDLIAAQVLPRKNGGEG